MPEYTPYAKIKVPLWSEPDQVPVDLKDAFTTIDSLLVLKAADPADRDAKYGDVPVGTIVVGTEVNGIWRKRESGWNTIWYDTGWLTSGLVQPAANVSIDGQYGRIVGSHVSLSIVCIWTGDPFESNSTGDITNRQLATAIGDFRPSYLVLGQYAVGAFNGGASMNSSAGAIYIKDGVANFTFTTGEEFRVNFEYGSRF